jgi:hypothetical protein
VVNNAVDPPTETRKEVDPPIPSRMFTVTVPLATALTVKEVPVDDTVSTELSLLDTL